jgi:Tol biopolymer transport system component
MRARLALAAAAAIAAVSTVAPASVVPGETIRVSVTTGIQDARQANGDTPALSVPDTTSPALSLDGRWAAFSSDATNLVNGDTNGVADVFIRDLVTGTTTRASAAADGAQANGASYSPAMSVDGRWLAYASQASNIVNGDSNHAADIFLADLRKGTVRRISAARDGAEANGGSNSPFVSLFGEWVTFDSAASNLARGDDNDMTDAFVFTRRSARIRRLDAPDPPTDWSTPLVSWTHSASIGFDGHYLTYVAATKRVIPDAPQAPAGAPAGPPAVFDQPVASDVHVLNLRSGHDRVVPILLKDGKYRWLADHPAISADGKRAVFEAWNVVDPHSVPQNADPNADAPLEPDPLMANPVDHRQIVMYDLKSRTVNPFSRSGYGFPSNGDAFNPQISSEGHVITFASDASNIVPGDTNGVTDIFVVDTRERATSRISLGPDFAEANAQSVRPQMSYDGRSVVFASPSTNLVEGDTNGRWDVFLHDRHTEAPNASPRLTTPFLFTLAEGMRCQPPDNPACVPPEIRLINPLEETRLQLRARDPDGDELRFGILKTWAPALTADPADQVPDGMAVDPMTGLFTWTPAVQQAGPWKIAFWVEDMRGQAHFGVASYAIRDLRQMALCKAAEQC